MDTRTLHTSSLIALRYTYALGDHLDLYSTLAMGLNYNNTFGHAISLI